MTDASLEFQIVQGSALDSTTQSKILALQKTVLEQEVLVMGVPFHAPLTETDLKAPDTFYFLNYRTKADTPHLIGFLCLEQLNTNEYSITRLFVDPSQFGQGSSSALLRAALNYVTKCGAVIVDNSLILEDSLHTKTKPETLETPKDPSTFHS